MPYPDKIELAREKIRQAESALADYLHNPAFDSDQAKQLMNAVRHPPQSGWLDEWGRLKGGHRLV